MAEALGLGDPGGALSLEATQSRTLCYTSVLVWIFPRYSSWSTPTLETAWLVRIEKRSRGLFLLNFDAHRCLKAREERCLPGRVDSAQVVKNSMLGNYGGVGVEV